MQRESVACPKKALESFFSQYLHLWRRRAGVAIHKFTSRSRSIFFLLSLTTQIFTSTLRSVVNGCEPLNQVGPMSQWSKSNGMNVIGDSSQVKSNCLVCAGGKSEIVKRLPQKVKVKGTVT